MPTFEPGDVVRVPFPYSDAETTARRPAAVVATAGPRGEDGAPLLVWALMVTSAENRPWADDVAVGDLDAAGLPAPSVVRCAKIATLEGRRAERIGRLDAPALAAVRAALAARLGGG